MMALYDNRTVFLVSTC